MEEKNVSIPQWGKISREEYEKKKRDDITKVARITPPDLKVNPAIIEEKSKEDPKRVIRKQLEIMHKEALTRTLGLDKPQNELCQTCFSVLQGDRYIINSGSNMYICRKCYQSLKRCSNCGRPVKQEIRGMKVQYCEYCKPQKECVSCGKEISVKEGLRIEGVRGFYCAQCYQSEKCYICGVPVVKNHYKISTDTFVCHECVVKSIVKPEQGMSIVEEVKTKLSELFSTPITTPVKIGVVTLEELNEDFNKENFRVVRNHDMLVVLIALGITEEMVYSKIAFELSKSFISNNLGALQPDEVYSGFGKYIQCIFIESKGYIEEAKKLRKEEYLKSEFQHFLKLEKKLGFQRVISTIKKHKMPISL